MLDNSLLDAPPSNRSLERNLNKSSNGSGSAKADRTRDIKRWLVCVCLEAGNLRVVTRLKADLYIQTKLNKYRKENGYSPATIHGYRTQ